jgi:hypothetical protein
MKCLFSITPDARTGGEVAEQVYAEKHVTDAHDAHDKRAVQCLSPNPSSATRDYVEWHDRRAGVRATDADVSVCRPRAEKASDFALRQMQDGVCQPPVRCVCRHEAWFGALCTAFVTATDAGGFGN